MTSSLKSFLLLVLLTLIAAPQAKAETPESFSPVNVVYLIRDESAPNGYREKFHWQIRSQEDWNRFYDTLPGLPLDKTNNSDPMKSKVDDMIIMSREDANKLTGFDIYLSNLGIMIVRRGATHTYFPDTNKFRAFLEQEQKTRSSFETFLDNKEIAKNAQGMTIIYNVNKNIPNPTWLIDKPDDLALYSDFFKGLTPIPPFDLRYHYGDENYDDTGVFFLTLNYPGSPGENAAVTKRSIRVSTPFISSEYLQDTKKYYQYFKAQANEMINYNQKYKVNELEADERREF